MLLRGHRCSQRTTEPAFGYFGNQEKYRAKAATISEPKATSKEATETPTEIEGNG